MKTLKYILAVLIAVQSILTIPTAAKSSGELSLSARSAALYEPMTQEFLYTKNENERLGMASTTKIMTALIALDMLDLDQEIEIDERAIGVDGSSVYLEQGEIMSAEGLIYSLILRSANDAAEALAYEISGSIEDFCALMNDKAEELNLTDTHFNNPHGLDADGHYTTAHDLAIISAEALKNPKFREISSTYKKEVESNLQSRTLVNHNKLLKRYDGCIGVKTGYTQKCGRSLVGAAERNGLTLISVTIDAPNDWEDHKKLLDLGFSTIRAIKIAEAGELTFTVPVINGSPNTIKITNKNALKTVCKGEVPDIKREITLPRFFTENVSQGDTVGKVTYKADGKILMESDLIAEQTTVVKKKKGFLERIFK